ncbi:AraC family transcriptional regulator [Catenuloplanes atrovinosus]|uniref:AraC-like DNA-binding protein n=1 Tax=Catenuloplanes atrovinosus TaxID=137266 RepID=A0AAE3YR52_9ACTN|nr:AraC family transcriptional regulator [Catenuloplanes atrovinosus]MDR7277127.1 AraC-like DNA-binding protein [Catenuloplanes atrovinosus]
MDVLSDVIASMRTGRAKFARTRHLGRWGNRFGPYPGAGFHVVLAGSCWLLPPTGEPARLTAGDVVFLPHGAVHGLSDTPTRALDRLAPQLPDGPDLGDGDPDAGDALLLCGAYRLDHGNTHPFLRQLPEVIHLPAQLGRHPALRAAVDLLGADLTASRPGADAALPALLDLLLIYVLRAWLDEQTGNGATEGWSAALADHAVATALHHMHRDPARPWTVQQLGALTGLSRTAFARRFTATMGQAPLAYLTWWRLNTAARLLSRDDAALATIARRVGYSSEFAFAAAFKRQYGVSPGRYGREHRAHPTRSDQELDDASVLS